MSHEDEFIATLKEPMKEEGEREMLMLSTAMTIFLLCVVPSAFSSHAAAIAAREIKQRRVGGGKIRNFVLKRFNFPKY